MSFLTREVFAIWTTTMLLKVNLWKGERECEAKRERGRMKLFHSLLGIVIDFFLLWWWCSGSHQKMIIIVGVSIIIIIIIIIESYLRKNMYRLEKQKTNVKQRHYKNAPKLMANTSSSLQMQMQRTERTTLICMYAMERGRGIERGGVRKKIFHEWAYVGVVYDLWLLFVFRLLIFK